MQAALSSQLWSVHCSFVLIRKQTPMLDDHVNYEMEVTHSLTTRISLRNTCADLHFSTMQVSCYQ